MTRLIDADAFDAIINDDGTIDEYATETARNAMLIMPTVDAVPVVRCEQCIWWNTGECIYWTGDGVFTLWHDYCSRGTRGKKNEKSEQ